MISQQTLKGNLVLQDYTTAFTLNQGDKGVPFRIELLENGTPYTLLSGDIVVIEWLKPNGNPFLQEGGIKYGTNYIEFTTPESVAQYSGSGTFNIIITNNNVRKGTIRREYRVVPTSMKPGSVSEDTITDAITELRELSVEIADTVQNNQDLINNNQAATKQDISNINSSLEEKASKTFVSYQEFGAVLDGVTDDSVAIKACHAYANTNGLKVIQNGGKVLCNFTVDVLTDCELKVEFIINDDTPTTVYNIISDSEETITLNTTLETDQMSGFDTSLNGKFFVACLENSTYYLGKRSMFTEGNTYYHRQPMAIDKTGYVISSPVYLGNSGAFTLKYYKDLDEKGVTFEGGKVTTTLAKIGFPRLVKCSRNNSTIKNISIKNTTTPTSTSNYSGGLIDIVGCANILLENINGLNNSLNTEDAESYVINLTDSFNIQIDKCNLSQGWGVMASHWCDNVFVTNSTINRFDNHYGCFGKYQISNSTLTGIGKICAGYGNGKFIINDIIVQNSVDASFIFYTRNDFNITFSGELVLNNIRFNNETFDRIVEYRVGDGDSNEDLSKGSFKLFCYNVYTTKSLINNVTSNNIKVYIYNSKIKPSTANGTNTIDIFNSEVTSLNSNGVVRLFGGRLISLGSIFTNAIYAQCATIQCEVNNSDITLYISGCQLYNNITCKSVYITSSFAISDVTITADYKQLNGNIKIS